MSNNFHFSIIARFAFLTAVPKARTFSKIAKRLNGTYYSQSQKCDPTDRDEM